ncbi:siderophore-interacting protein [uncultured Stenotrophomonas sp.]|uniref:siderophore-interacting protein n=1 Tax=uncultured Stenotrophomonas sp. TaxID=165438 RepID=UPI0025E99206|nr:siderophore-interacting protein [uncultured Stenotrophomonas sp.]
MTRHTNSKHAELFTVQVKSIEALTPHMRRITVTGPGAAAFLMTPGVEHPAAWVKVFLPTGEGRAYTLRRIDRQQAEIDLDFVLHGHGNATGPLSSWAEQARIGDEIGIAGPRSGEWALPEDARWVILAGDATALPAMQAIAATLPNGIDVRAYVEIPSAADRQPIEAPSGVLVNWIEEGASPGLSLQHAVLNLSLPLGPGYVWIAGESTSVRALRLHLKKEHAIDRRRLSAMGYWKAGSADHRE